MSARFRVFYSSRTGGTWTRSWAPIRSRRSKRRFNSTSSNGPRRRTMRASTARLMNSPVRLADLVFPQTHRLIHRTRLAFIHFDNLLLFFRKGEAVNAASLHTAGRQVITIGEGLRRMRAEMERGELAYCQAPMEQLAWMYQCCAAPAQAHVV